MWRMDQQAEEVPEDHRPYLTGTSCLVLCWSLQDSTYKHVTRDFNVSIKLHQQCVTFNLFSDSNSTWLQIICSHQIAMLVPEKGQTNMQAAACTQLHKLAGNIWHPAPTSHMTTEVLVVVADDSLVPFMSETGSEKSSQLHWRWRW